MVFNAVFNISSTATSAPIHAFLELFIPVLRTIFFSSHWLLSHITFVETMNVGERGINSCRKDYYQFSEGILAVSEESNQRPHVVYATDCAMGLGPNR